MMVVMQMRGPIVGLVLGALAGAGMGFVPLTPAVAQSERDAALDILFEQLRNASSPQEAQRIDQQIWVIWTTPDDPMLAAQMAEILEARRVMDIERAMELIEAVVARHPDYAEGWNQRATVNFMLGDFEASLADIDRVLMYEPRHFGALAGKALIHRQLGQDQEALEAMTRALAVHPFLAERALFPELAAPIVRI